MSLMRWLPFLVLFGSMPLAGGAEFFVSPRGDDAGPGDRSRPFATLERARDAVRELKRKEGLPEDGVTVRIGPGTYYRSRPLQLSEEDSGTPGAPVAWKGEPGSTRLVGGRPVDGWEPVTDSETLGRLPQGAREHVLRADLAARGLADLGELKPRGFARPVYDAPLELFFGGRPMTLARWPNEGFATIAELPEGKDGDAFGYEGDRPVRWREEPDPWTHGYWYQDWADGYLPVAGIDPEHRVIRLGEPGPHYGYRKGQRWYALNLLCELDSPGEYYVDRSAGVLYFWPPAPVEENEALVSTTPGLVSVRGASHLRLEGLSMEVTRGTAVTVRNGTDVSVVNCTVRNTGNRAVVIKGGSRNGVVGCDISGTGDGGIVISGGDRPSLTPAGHFVTDCRIRRFSRTCRTYRPAVKVAGIGQRVAHNLIHHAPHCGILLSGNEHLIELNELHHLCYETGDVGAFYMGRDWTARGTRIRHNFFHHVSGPGRYGANGVYLDDAASGITVTGNVFYKVTKAAFIGGGRDNLVANNIFADCEPAIHVDARGLGWMADSTRHTGTLNRRLRKMPYERPPWSERYPELVDILRDEPAAPKGNRIVRNVQWGGSWADIDRKAEPYLTVENNLRGVDPRFVDPEGMDFRLREDSPAWKIGFDPIPFARIGPRQESARSR